MEGEKSKKSTKTGGVGERQRERMEEVNTERKRGKRGGSPDHTEVKNMARGEEIHLQHSIRIPPAGNAAERLGKQEMLCVCMQDTFCARVVLSP